MDIILFSIILVFALILLILGFVRNQIILIVFSAIAFIFSGIVSINGIEYVSSTIVTITNSTTTTIIHNYSNWNHYFGSTNLSINLVLGFLLSLFGIFLLLVSSSMTLMGKSNIDLSSDDEE